MHARCVGMAAAESMVAARRALDDLYRSHAAEVYRYAYAVLGNHADAEDVTQTTFVNALRALERGERPRKPSNWLITITHNIVRQRFRQQQARPDRGGAHPRGRPGAGGEQRALDGGARSRAPADPPEPARGARAAGARGAVVRRDRGDPQPHEERARNPPLPRPPLPRRRARERRDVRSGRAQPLPAARRPNFPQGAQAAPRSHRGMPGLRAPPGDPGQAAARVQGPCPPPPPLRAHVLQGRAERIGGNGAAHDRSRRRDRRRSSAAGPPPAVAFRSAACTSEASPSRRPPSSRPHRSRAASASSAPERSIRTVALPHRIRQARARTLVRRPSDGPPGHGRRPRRRPAARLQRAGVAAAGANRGKATATHDGNAHWRGPECIGSRPCEGVRRMPRRWQSPRPTPTPRTRQRRPPAAPPIRQARRHAPPPAKSVAKADGKATADKPTKTPATPAIPASSGGIQDTRDAGNARNSGVIVERERTAAQGGRRPRAVAEGQRQGPVAHGAPSLPPLAQTSGPGQRPCSERASIGQRARLPGASRYVSARRVAGRLAGVSRSPWFVAPRRDRGDRLVPGGVWNPLEAGDGRQLTAARVSSTDESRSATAIAASTHRGQNCVPDLRRSSSSALASERPGR